MDAKTKLGFAVLLIALIIVALLSIGLTVFKPKHIEVKVASVALSDFDHSPDVLEVPEVPVGLNLSVTTTLFLKNPNWFEFEYDGMFTMLVYKRHQVGLVMVPKGRISARETKRVIMRLNWMDPHFSGDVVDNGMTPINLFAGITGKIRALSYKPRVTSSILCDMLVNVGSRSVAGRTCESLGYRSARIFIDSLKE